MNGLLHVWEQGDLVSRGVAAMLLLMSIAAWVIILWKGWVLARVRRDMAQGVGLLWQARDLGAARQAVEGVDREGVMVPLIDAAQGAPAPGTLEDAGDPEAQLTRRLRDALHAVLTRLQAGQVLLASVGAVSPFVGLFGTVWGIYHAMIAISTEGSVGIDKVAGPVGESLIMTATGLAVAIPAVLAYNVLGKYVSACEADLEGLAHDLRELVLGRPASGRGD
ncbi:MotA/TolQ/ExbB proton channel family protein [Aquabacterium sp.]|uniref:MotA/TolQ/ExbB proton channel family protein n=1 Tax=Aquabacterium sp. TaxID=1872578 RepID=UPI0035B1E3EB